MMAKEAFRTGSSRMTAATVTKSVKGNGWMVVGRRVARALFENVIRIFLKTLSEPIRWSLHAYPAAVHDCQEAENVLGDREITALVCAPTPRRSTSARLAIVSTSRRIDAEAGRSSG
jgi:hypothetical protein